MTSQNTARETMMPTPPRRRQQVRNFALIWSGITLMIGACTFISIYAATGIAANAKGNLAPVSISAKTTNPSDGADAAAIASTAGSSDATEAPDAAVAAVPTNTTEPTKVAATSAPDAAGGAPTATINPIKDTDFDLGIAVQDNPDPNVYKVWVDMAGKQLKLNWVKTQVVWRDVEAVKGKIDWTAMDVSIKMLHAANIKVLLAVAKAPNWARDKNAPTDKPGVLDGPPSNPQDYADFLTAILQRYPGMINAIEVWNEVNLDREWSTAPQQLDPARYVSLLKAAHDAIKAADPNVIVVTSALSPTGANNGVNYVDDFVYMDKLIKAGMLNYADCVGAHHNGLNVPPDADYKNIPERTPRAKYRGPWENPNHSWSFKSTIMGYADKVKAAGSNLKLCVTEFGWPTADGLTGNLRSGFEFVKDNTIVDQANFTELAITEMQQWGFVRLAIVFNLNYGAQAGWSLEGGVGDNVVWSILGKDFVAHPVWKKIEDRNFRGQPRKAS
ncbi:MAG: beta-galactosidase [Chloroflexota bacterium]